MKWKLSCEPLAEVCRDPVCSRLAVEGGPADRDGHALQIGRLATMDAAALVDGRAVRRLEMVKLVRRLTYEDLARRQQRKVFAQVCVRVRAGSPLSQGQKGERRRETRVGSRGPIGTASDSLGR